MCVLSCGSLWAEYSRLIVGENVESLAVNVHEEPYPGGHSLTSEDLAADKGNKIQEADDLKLQQLKTKLFESIATEDEGCYMRVYSRQYSIQGRSSSNQTR
ncbi:hypothetical protein CEXT_231241 [Caerostris extrusa]|uniref:Uncharacterized protein n=1 Tax=Caerostris extrusa TaxID=172846 RepID=A0AAV4RC82_CAEEX|nr:hypothetical protein CEXT_231241 [Caerostris extrusa]